jgi:hypothetical protein
MEGVEKKLCTLTPRLATPSTHCCDSEEFFIIKPTRNTNFSNLFLKLNSTCFGQFLCPLSEVSHCTHNNGVCHTGFLTVCEQDQDGTAFRNIQSFISRINLRN